MEKEASQPVKPRFSEVCQQYHLDYQAMQEIARKAGVPKEVINEMSVGKAVHRKRAISVLSALSAYTGDTWTVDTVRVPLLPTFPELHAFQQFDLAFISITSGISFDTISRMVRGEPVTEREARLVLRAAHYQSRLYYRFDNIDVKLSDADGTSLKH